MWRPTEIGEVFAERAFDVEVPGMPSRRLVARVGRPLREPSPDEHAPWWCPVEIVGLDHGFFRAVGGIDSFQALILALEYLADRLPDAVEDALDGATVKFLGEQEAIVLARQFTTRGHQNAITALIAGMARASTVLASVDAGIEERTRAMRACLAEARSEATKERTLSAEVVRATIERVRAARAALREGAEGAAPTSAHAAEPGEE